VNENVKIGAAALGGYVLGRTKKAKAAIGLGLWLTGHNYRVKDLARDRVVSFLQSPEGEKLLNELRGPAVEAGKRAVMSIYERQADRLSDSLHNRTQGLTGQLEGGVGSATKQKQRGSEEDGQARESDDELQDYDESEQGDEESQDDEQESPRGGGENGESKASTGSRSDKQSKSRERSDGDRSDGGSRSHGERRTRRQGERAGRR
jgi:hypothetical protein